METNDRLTVWGHDACNGKPIAGGDTSKSADRSRGVGRMTLWGLSMVMVALFRFFMTWVIGVSREPVDVTLTSVIGVVGMMLFAWGRLKDRAPVHTP